MKKALWKVPTLASPIPSEILSMYLSTTMDAISAVLTVERQGKQLLVYFVSRALQGVKLNYQMTKKVVLTLVYVAI